MSTENSKDHSEQNDNEYIEKGGSEGIDKPTKKKHAANKKPRKKKKKSSKADDDGEKKKKKKKSKD